LTDFYIIYIQQQILLFHTKCCKL